MSLRVPRPACHFACVCMQIRQARKRTSYPVCAGRSGTHTHTPCSVCACRSGTQTMFCVCMQSRHTHSVLCVHAEQTHTRHVLCTHTDQAHTHARHVLCVHADQTPTHTPCSVCAPSSDKRSPRTRARLTPAARLPRRRASQCAHREAACPPASAWTGPACNCAHVRAHLSQGAKALLLRLGYA